MINEKSFINQSNIRFLFVTANTGTVFEKPDLITAWVNEFADLVRQQPSDFIALHCQEVGGKDYERFMHILDPFIKTILQIPEIATDFTHYRLYFDSDYTSQETFTALGSAYFIRHNIPIEQWNFTTSSFETVVDRQIFTGNLINAQTLRKEKFPREFFSEAKWSRKGFTQTRWSIDGFIFDVVNVHLFHDASNLIAVEQSPSIYSHFRKNALEHTLRSLPLDPSETSVPYAIFGDFNFRLDTCRLLQHIVEERNGSLDRVKKPNSDEISRIILKTDEDQAKLVIEKKEFNFNDDHDTYFLNNAQKCQTFDFELTPFTEQLFEYEKIFPPSYPYSEELDEARSYLRARCPAWCDRVFLSHSFKELIRTEIHQPIYNLIGESICMGDHKPVYLALTIHSIPVISSNCDDQTALSNLNKCDLINILSKNSNNQNESLVTVARENTSKLILNEIPLLSDDFNQFNIHDYAMFVQSNILPECWLNTFQQRPVKSPHNSNKLWAKVRAVTYFTRLVHRPGSWYSDDQTEISPTEDTSLSDIDEKDNLPMIDLNDFNDYKRRTDLAIPLRRSFSSIDYTKNPDASSPTLSRSRSTTLINPPESLLDSPSSDLPSPSSTSTMAPTSITPTTTTTTLPQTSSRANDNMNQVKNVNCGIHTNGLNSKIEDLNTKKVAYVLTNTNDHRTVRARHIFHSNLKRTITRRIRETPV